MGDTQQRLNDNYPPIYAIQTKLYSVYAQFYRFKQYWSELKFNSINTIQWLLNIVTLAGIIWAFTKNIPDVNMQNASLLL